MEHNTDRLSWTVFRVALFIAAIGIFLSGVGIAIANGNKTYQKYETGSSIVQHHGTNSDVPSNNTVDSSSDSDFSYSAPNTADDTISITGYKGHEENLVIPEYRKIGSVYYKVTSISNFAFQNNQSIKQLTIPDGLRTIGMSAFLYASNLKSLTLGSDVTSIGDCAFDGTALTRVDFPASVTSIGYRTFNDTPISAISFRKRVNLSYGSFTNTKLTSVTLPTGSTCNELSLDANTIKKVFDPNVNVTIK